MTQKAIKYHWVVTSKKRLDLFDSMQKFQLPQYDLHQPIFDNGTEIA